MATPSLAINLPWQALGQQANMLQGLGGDPRAAMAQLGQNYSNSYQGALNLNANLFGGIQTGYENLRGQLDKQYSDISGGYQKLYGDVLGKIAGTNQTNLTDIDTSYMNRAGEATQQMVNRGLGNSTVQQNMQRAIEMDRSRARTASENAFAQLQAQYMSQLGQAGLGAQREGAQLGTQLGQNQLQWLNTIQAPYPQAAAYQDLAKMYGAQLQGQQDRQAMQQASNPNSGLTFTRGGVGGVSSGSAGPLAMPRMNQGGGGGGGSTFGFGGYSAPQQVFQPPAAWGFSGGGGGGEGFYEAGMYYPDAQTYDSMYTGDYSGTPLDTSYYDYGSGEFVNPNDFGGY